VPDQEAAATLAAAGVNPGMCGDCRHALVKETHRGTAYLRCGRAAWDDRLVKYPRLPVTKCEGYAPKDQQARR
jgi:propionyl-CoA synthetase